MTDTGAQLVFLCIAGGFAVAGCINEMLYGVLSRASLMPIDELVKLHPDWLVRRFGQIADLVFFVICLLSDVPAEFCAGVLAMMGVEELVRRDILNLSLRVFHPVYSLDRMGERIRSLRERFHCALATALSRVVMAFANVLYRVWLACMNAAKRDAFARRTAGTANG